MKLKRVIGYTLIALLLIFMVFGVPCIVGAPWWYSPIITGVVVLLTGFAVLVGWLLSS